MSKPITMSVAYVRTRNSENLRLRVNGKLVTLGGSGRTSCDRARNEATTMLANAASAHGLYLVSIEMDYNSDHLRNLWTMRAVLAPANLVAAALVADEAALAADDAAECAEQRANDAEECGNPDASALRRDAQACAERAARLAEVACEVKRINARLEIVKGGAA